MMMISVFQRGDEHRERRIIGLLLHLQELILLPPLSRRGHQDFLIDGDDGGGGGGGGGGGCGCGGGGDYDEDEDERSTGDRE